MALKLKLKVGGNSSGNDTGSGSNKQSPEPSSVKAPKIKLNPPKIKKLKVAKPDKIKKLKISFGANKATGSVPVDGITQPVKKVPKVRIKPSRTPGEGYDSETPDMEDDPLIENGIVIRFLDDMNLDLVHNAVDSNDLSGINIKWMTKDKALVNLKGNVYAARLVDLPTVSEVFKTVDKKNIFKILDLCQMLLVLRPVLPNEFNINSDFEVPKDLTYRHPLYDFSPDGEIRETRPVMKDGLIQPFENVFRRFKPRKINHKVMDDIEARVDEMIKLDNEAEESHFEILDPSQVQNNYSRFSPSPPPTTNTYQTDIISEDFIGGTEEEEEEDVDLEEELAKALETNVGIIEGENGDIIVEGETPVGDEDDEDEEDEDGQAENDEDEDDDDDDEDDEEEDEEDDVGHGHGKQHFRMLEEEIQDLEKAVEVHRKGLDNATHKMMKMKFQNSYNTLKASLDSKKRELARLIEEENGGKNEPEPEQEEEEEEEQKEDDESDLAAGMDDLDDLF